MRKNIIFTVMLLTCILLLIETISEYSIVISVPYSLPLPDHFSKKFQGKKFEGIRFSKENIAIAKHMIDMNIEHDFYQEMIHKKIKEYPVFLTAFSSNHFHEGCKMLKSFYKVYKKRARMIMYDIGLR